MLIVALFGPALQKLSPLWNALFSGRDRLKMYEVLIPDGRNYLGPKRTLHDLHFRAKDIEEARVMLVKFREKFPYPRYHDPVELGPYLSVQFSLVFRKEHNVLWREERPDGSYHETSCDIVDLSEYEVK